MTSSHYSVNTFSILKNVLFNVAVFITNILCCRDGDHLVALEVDHLEEDPEEGVEEVADLSVPMTGVPGVVVKSQGH